MLTVIQQWLSYIYTVKHWKLSYQLYHNHGTRVASYQNIEVIYCNMKHMALIIFGRDFALCTHLLTQGYFLYHTFIAPWLRFWTSSFTEFSITASILLFSVNRRNLYQFCMSIWGSARHYHIRLTKHIPIWFTNQSCLLFEQLVQRGSNSNLQYNSLNT